MLYTAAEVDSSPLIYAVYNNNFEILRLLVEHGFKPFAEYNCGFELYDDKRLIKSKTSLEIISIVEIAYMLGRTEMFEYLLQKSFETMLKTQKDPLDHLLFWLSPDIRDLGQDLLRYNEVMKILVQTIKQQGMMDTLKDYLWRNMEELESTKYKRPYIYALLRVLAEDPEIGFKDFWQDKAAGSKSWDTDRLDEFFNKIDKTQLPTLGALRAEIHSELKTTDYLYEQFRKSATKISEMFGSTPPKPKVEG